MLVIHGGEFGAGPRISRRRLLQASAVAAGSLYVPAFRLDRADAQAGCPAPPDFPAGIELYQQGYENWAKTIVVDDVWTCAPASGREVAKLANWACESGYRLRPRGAMHGWSPFTLPKPVACADRIVLVDTAGLDGIELASATAPTAKVGAGVTMEALLAFAEANGLGLTSVPATGAPTVGGALAVGAHGAAVPASGEKRPAGATYGSLSNLVVALRVVVWNEARGRYVVRTVKRSDPLCKVLLTNLGRVFVVKVWLRLAENTNLRCRSYTDIPASELFASPGSGGRTFESFLDETGRAESILFPYTGKPWFKTWDVSPTKPAESKAVNAPYNYIFSDNLPEELNDLLGLAIGGSPELTPLFGEGQYQAVEQGLTALGLRDLWGPAKNTQLYIKATTLRIDDSGYAIVTKRGSVQRVLHEVFEFYTALVAEYQGRGEYPINGPFQVRVSGIDRPHHCGVPGAEAPVLSPTTPDTAHRDRDSVVWVNLLTFPGTEGSYAFYRDMERFIFRTFKGDYATVRPEWSKGWAYGPDADFVDADVLDRRIPDAFRRGRPAGADWDRAKRTFRRFDPHHVFSNDFLDRLI